MTAVLTWLTIGWAALLLSCLVSMMAVFMGSASSDLRGLIAFQAVALPAALLALALYLRYARRAAGGRGGAALLWRHTPGWLVFVVASAASLTLIAELSLLLLDALTEERRPVAEHVPALTALAAGVALAASYACLRVRESVR